MSRPTQSVVDGVRELAEPLVARQPWAGWLLVALCRYRARLAWLVRVSDEHLSDVEDDQGEVPGLDGWSYAFHGTGLCLTGPGGPIDMDFDIDADEGTVLERSATIDPYFFAGWVRSQSDHPEVRLQQLLPSADWVAAGLKALRHIGAVQHPTSRHVFRLASSLEQLHAAVDALDFEHHETRREWAAAFGDDSSGLERTRKWAVTHLRSSRRDASMLRQSEPLLSRSVRCALAVELLDGPVDSALGYAAELLHRAGEPPTASGVAVLARLDPATHHPFPAVAVTSWLLAHDVERARCLEVIEAFAAVDVVKGYHGNPMRDRLAIGMARHAPERSWPLLRLAVFDGTPSVYEPIGALLAVLPDRRGPRLLLEAALASEPTQRRFLLACLSHSDHPGARDLAAAHMPEPPERESPVGFTFEEVQYLNLRPTVERWLARAREVVARLRPH